MLGDTLGCAKQEDCYWHGVGRGWGVTKHPTVHRTAPMTKDYPATSTVLRLRNSEGQQAR